MNDKILQYLKSFSSQLQKELQELGLIEELFSNLEEEGINAKVEIEIIISDQNKKELNFPLRSKICLKDSAQNKPQFVLTIEDLEFLRSLGIEPLKKEKSIKK